MSQLFATALLLTLGAGSAGLLSTMGMAPPSVNSPRLFQGLGTREADLTQAADLAQAEFVVSLSRVAQASGAIAADICVDLPAWQRPSDATQAKQLESMPRYGAVLQSDPLAELAKSWWSHSIFSFTTYGLSARTDPLYLSGVWTALDDTWNCYGSDQGEQINQGTLAELWLLHHRLVSLTWEDSQYQITVEPAETGLQMVQFLRQEQGSGLPLSIVTTTGQALAVMSGDW
jgi:hypothetical protein